jgi:D-sedoheptulose 7-phosphate isomerase
MTPARLAAARLRESARVTLAVARTHGAAFDRASALIVDALRGGRTVLFCGNGGSAADAQHLATEFSGRFLKERRALAAVALTTDSSALTAISNDYGFDRVFARQIEAIGRPGDVLVALSTSGRSPNMLKAIRAARRRGIAVVGLTGSRGRAFARLCDAAFVVPHALSPRIQETHIAIGHVLCEIAETALTDG